MTTQQVQVGPHTFDVAVEGPDGWSSGGSASAPTVVLLHGFPQNHRCFDAVVPRLHAAGMRTVVPDQRGYSPGARPVGVEHYRVPELVSDVLGIADALGVGWFHLVGHDWGAAVAWQLAARHPDRVSSLVAASVGHPVAFAAALTSDADQQARSDYFGLFAQEGHAEDVLLADDAARLRAMVADGGQDATGIEASVGPLRDRGALTAALSWYRAMRGEDYRDVPAVEVPTTFLWSDADQALGRAQAVATGRYAWGEYRFVELAGVSHWIPEQAPVELAGEIALRSSPW